MLSRFLALFVLVGTTFAQAATPPTAATVDVWPEGKMPGKGASVPEAEVPRNDGFHRIPNVSRPTLTLFPVPRKAGAAAAQYALRAGIPAGDILTERPAPAPPGRIWPRKRP